MADDPGRSALLSALTTEHFVLQTANSSTYAEASARSTLYVMALSSALVAMGFLSSTTDAFVPFAVAVLPAIFVLGLFTVVRLVDTALESMHYLAGIARIRAVYRTLGADAERHFAPQFGRWPETRSPAERLGNVLAFMGTTASMIAVLNNLVAGAAVALALHLVAGSVPGRVLAGLGVAVALALTAAFYFYQRWRFADFDSAARRDGDPAPAESRIAG
jgi:hypothetical protein